MLYFLVSLSLEVGDVQRLASQTLEQHYEAGHQMNSTSSDTACPNTSCLMQPGLVVLKLLAVHWETSHNCIPATGFP